ncbi:hypothetical protein GT016_14795 [Streptomyces sp. SID3915]|nr:hypothetical protein [Streptomyces sp. SID3915]MYX73788.1 hypothetical protein [Streptomyces sp. SID3915]
MPRVRGNGPEWSVARSDSHAVVSPVEVAAPCPLRLRADLNDLVGKGQSERRFVFRKGTSTGFLAPVNWRRSGSCTYDAAPKGAGNMPATA